MSKNGTPKTTFQVLAGDANSFVTSLIKLRETHYIKKEWISTTIMTIDNSDYEKMVSQVQNSPDLIAKIPKAQTTVMISGLFEVTEKPKKIIQP